MPPTDRKFNPQATSTQYTLNSRLSSTTLCLPQPTINFRSKTAFVWCSQRFDARNRRKLHTAYNPDLAHHTSAPSQCLIHTNPRSAVCSSSTAQDYHPNVWSNSSSGIGSASTPALCNNRSCPASALRVAAWSNSSLGIASNTASGAASSCPIFISSGGERAGAITGAMVGSPTCSSICRTVAGSMMNPTRRTRPPHPPHLGGNTPQMRASNCAHKYHAGCPARVAPKSVRSVFGRGALLHAPGFQQACAATCARHGKLGASTPM